ncbi:ATP-dependent DNA helicase DinG [Paenibacillus koleovorans]|uniref:ATP-dependent DNA helicase DinG n=1 Tax=Paenibacillus koleovorans TaxID=121608 RepID=UPI000FD9986B|nr:ATP-dependent DNA helicase DinG [Paenibacillus koleovorans]
MKFVVIDFETTGDQPSDEIIQVGLVVIEQGQITDSYTSFIKPSRTIPGFIVQLTGITDEMVSNAPDLQETVSQMLPYFENAVLVAHHAAFDLGFLQRAFEQCGYNAFSGQVLDTIQLLRMLFPGLATLQLSMVTSHFGIPHDHPHRADSDAEATAHLWLLCLQKLESLPLLTLQKIAQLYVAEFSDLGWFLNEVSVWKQSQISLDPDTHQYFRQYAMNVVDWDEEKPLREEGEPALEESLTFEAYIEQINANLKQRFPDYEERPAQKQMIEEVQQSLSSDRHLIIEAGTGTGKSLGYLIPALYQGLKERKKMIVSTHTINLQEQLRQRDIPLLQDIVPVAFRAAVLKGRSRYLCLRKFEEKLQIGDFTFDRDERLTAAQMLVWLSETKHGDEEEIYFGSKGVEFWSSVSSDTDSCLNRACPWFKKCFFHRARHESNIADLVITNHSLLFTDIQAENRLLPSYKHLVVDEAHHFEEVASKLLGSELHFNGLMNPLYRLYRDAKSGQLLTLQTRIGQLKDSSSDEWSGWIDSLYPRIAKVREEWEKLSELLYQVVSELGDPSAGEGVQYVRRMKPDQLPAQWKVLLTIEDNLFLELTEITKKLDRLSAEMKERSDEYAVSSLLTDLNGNVKQLVRARDTLRFFMKMNNESYVYWLEATPHFRSRSVVLMYAPFDVSELLKGYFFDVKDSVVLTSATLSVNKTFDYSSGQLGLKTFQETPKLKTVQLPSPFEYRKQALVLIPRDFPSVKAAGDTAFIEALVASLRDVAIETNGRLLVLFTSYRMLKLVHQELTEQLKANGIHVLGQGIDSSNRSKLTRLFQDHEACVLLGTSSFWEGVDIPGDALTCLAIVRLPFQPPNHPMAEAKSDHLKKQRQNPFTALSVPQAVIRFKQGFGRLVRRSTDRGVVILYDTRVLETTYGRNFLYSLPGPKIEHLSVTQLVPRIHSWMGESVRENAQNI